MALAIERQCAFCGKTFTVNFRTSKQKCCSVSCAGKMAAFTGVDLDFEWKKERDGKYACRFNPEGCSCSNRRCQDCGWNPKVAQERSRKILKDLGGVSYG